MYRDALTHSCPTPRSSDLIVRRFKGPAPLADPSVGTATLRLSPVPNPSKAGEVPAPAHIVNCSHLHVSMRCAVIRNTRLAICPNTSRRVPSVLAQAPIIDVQGVVAETETGAFRPVHF